MTGRPHHRCGALTCLLVAGLTACNGIEAADVFSGERIYNRLCISCHGNRRQQSIPGAPNFSRGQRMMQPDGEMLEALRSGKRAMPSYLGVLDYDEMRDVIAYLRMIR